MAKNTGIGADMPPDKLCKPAHKGLMGLVAKFVMISRQNVPAWVKFGLIHLLSRLLCYWLPNLILHLMVTTGTGARWRIQGKRMPNPALVIHAIKHNVITDAVSYWGVSWAFTKLLSAGEAKQPVSPDSTLEVVDEHPRGWSGLQFGGASPGLSTQLWQVAVGYFGYDLMFYWSHRMLHHSSIYKLVHKRHHEFHTPVGPSASYEHPAEGAAQLLNWYLPIGFAGYLNGSLHWTTLLLYNCFRWLETVDAHCGYEFPFSPFHVLPWFGGATMHDYHHRAVLGNYGASMLWDRLCGTDSGYLEEVLEDGFLRAGKFVPSSM